MEDPSISWKQKHYLPPIDSKTKERIKGIHENYILSRKFVHKIGNDDALLEQWIFFHTQNTPDNDYQVSNDFYFVAQTLPQLLNPWIA